MVRKSVVATRTVLGVATILAPRVMGKIFGIDPKENPAAPYLARLFGARELLMAWQLHTAPDEQLLDRFKEGVAVDVVDAAAAILAGASGYLPKRAAIMSGLTAMGACAQGAMAVRELELEGADHG